MGINRYANHGLNNDAEDLAEDSMWARFMGLGDEENQDLPLDEDEFAFLSDRARFDHEHRSPRIDEE